MGHKGAEHGYYADSRKPSAGTTHSAAFMHSAIRSMILSKVSGTTSLLELPDG